MNEYKGATLPYRTSGDDIKHFIEAVARGRDMGQIQSLYSASGTFQGTVLAAQELGYVDSESNTLLELGKEFLLVTNKRPENLLHAIVGYEPYQLLLEAIFSRSTPSETPVEWIVNWWGTQGYGASQNNREEAATTLAKLLEYAGIGSFMIGRRGRPTRIEWSNNASETINRFINSTASSEPKGFESVKSEITQNSNSFEPAVQDLTVPLHTVDDKGEKHEYNTLSLTLGRGKSVQLRLPAELTSNEKDRLLKLMELMIQVHEEEATEN